MERTLKAIEEILAVDRDTLHEIEDQRADCDPKTHEGARDADALRIKRNRVEGRIQGLEKVERLLLAERREGTEELLLLLEIVRYSTPVPDTSSDYVPRSFVTAARELTVRWGTTRRLGWRAPRGANVRSTCGRFEIEAYDPLNGPVVFNVQNGDPARRVTYATDVATLQEAKDFAEGIHRGGSKNERIL